MSTRPVDTQNQPITKQTDQLGPRDSEATQAGRLLNQSANWEQTKCSGGICTFNVLVFTLCLFGLSTDFTLWWCFFFFFLFFFGTCLWLWTQSPVFLVLRDQPNETLSRLPLHLRAHGYVRPASPHTAGQTRGKTLASCATGPYSLSPPQLHPDSLLIPPPTLLHPPPAPTLLM